MSTVKFCMDCRWAMVHGRQATCHRPIGVHLDLVFGKEEMKTALTDCEYERQDAYDRCGSGARFWEASVTSPLWNG